MHKYTFILLSILLLLLLNIFIEGFTTLNWPIPEFSNEIKTIEVNNKNVLNDSNKSLPVGYSTISMINEEPVNLENIRKMFETNINTNTYSAILDKLDDIETKLSKESNKNRVKCSDIKNKIQCPSTKKFTSKNIFCDSSTDDYGDCIKVCCE